MPQLNSSDILNIVLAFAVLWVGIMAGWAGWYLVQILRDVRHLTGSTREKIERVGLLLHDVREKLNSYSTYLALLGQGAVEVIGYLRDKKEKKAAPKKRVKIANEEIPNPKSQ